MAQINIEPVKKLAADWTDSACFDKVVEEFAEFVMAHRDTERAMRMAYRRKDSELAAKRLDEEALEGGDLITAMATYLWHCGIDLEAIMEAVNKKNKSRNYY